VSLTARSLSSLHTPEQMSRNTSITARKRGEHELREVRRTERHDIWERRCDRRGVVSAQGFHDTYTILLSEAVQ